MRFYSSFLLLCVSILCIKGTAGSYNHRHLLHKRQSQDDICNAVVGTSFCTNGYYEDYAYVVARCGQTSVARSFQDTCRSNSRGVICGNLDVDYQGFTTACSSSSNTCSPACRDFITTTRINLGCCVNIQNGSFSDPDPFSYSLWSACGVELVTEECGPSPFDLPTGIDPTCGANFFDLLYSNVLCKTQFYLSLRDSLLATPGCEVAAIPFGNPDNLASSCAVNEQGSYCEAMQNGLSDQVEIAAANCTNTSVCNPQCIGTLNNIINTFGCCFISRSNDTTSIQRDFLSYEFFQRCGITSPGFCDVRLNTSDARISGSNPPSHGAILKASSKIIGFAIALFFMMVFVFSY